MTSVLVVDDSQVDLRLVGELLEKDANLQLHYAADGAEALAKMQHALPDVVVTDLVMPEVDGLELVRVVTKEYPLVPVILITSQGNEEIAIQALQEGAASYVPKHGLAGNLLDTIHSVMTLSQRKRGHVELMEYLSGNEFAFVLENDPSLIEPLATHLQDEVARMGLCEVAERTRVGVALEEALKNALYHGNLEVGYELRERDKAAYDALVAERRQQSPYRDRRIHVEANLSRDEAIFVIRDDGVGFDPSKLPRPADPAGAEKLHGRGVLLMRTLMDTVTYNEAGNEVTLSKRRDPQSDLIENEDS